MAGKTKTVNGESLPMSAFAYCPDPNEPSTWKLRIDDPRHVAAAAAALGPGYRGQKVEIPEADRAAVVRKVRAAWKKHNPDADPDEMPEGIRASEPTYPQRRAKMRRQPVDDTDPGEETDQTDDREMAEPTAGNLHIDVPVGDEKRRKRTPDPLGDEDEGDTDDDETEASEKVERPGRTYLAKMRELLKGKVSAEDFNAAMRQARGHAGGKGKAARKAYDPDWAVPSYSDDSNDYLDDSALSNEDGDNDADDGAQPKYEKADPRIAYKATAPNANEMCLDCRNFDSDAGSCRIVEGVISPKGTCKMFGPIIVRAREFSESLDALRFADAPTWIPFLPKPGRYQHPTYGTMDLTPARIDRFIQNFNSGVYQNPVPIDAEHELKQSGAVGWAKALRKAADGSAEGRIDWNDRGHAFLEGDRFKFFSPEWYDSWTDPATGKVYRDVVIGGALTTRPFFKPGSLRPLAASEQSKQNGATSRHWLPIQRQGAEMGSHSHEHTHQDGTTHSHDHNHGESIDMDAKGHGDMPHPHSHEGMQMSEEQARRFTEMETALKQANEAAAKQAAELKTAQERIDRMEREKRHQRFSEVVRGDSETPSWAGNPDKQIALLENLADKFGEDSEAFKDYVSEQAAIAEQVRTAQHILTSEKGRSGFGGAQSFTERIAQAAAEKMRADTNLSEGDAQAAVFREHPDWYARYASETTVRVR